MKLVKRGGRNPNTIDFVVDIDLLGSGGRKIVGIRKIVHSIFGEDWHKLIYVYRPDQITVAFLQIATKENVWITAKRIVQFSRASGYEFAMPIIRDLPFFLREAVFWSWMYIFMEYVKHYGEDCPYLDEFTKRVPYKYESIRHRGVNWISEAGFYFSEERDAIYESLSRHFPKEVVNEIYKYISPRAMMAYSLCRRLD